MNIQTHLLELVKGLGDSATAPIIEIAVAKELRDLGFIGVSISIELSENGTCIVTPHNLVTAVVLGENGKFDEKYLTEHEYLDTRNEILYRYYDGKPCKMLYKVPEILLLNVKKEM